MLIATWRGYWPRAIGFGPKRRAGGGCGHTRVRPDRVERVAFLEIAGGGLCGSGDFDLATQYQVQAMASISATERDLNEMQRHLALYLQHKPVHEAGK